MIRCRFCNNKLIGINPCSCGQVAISDLWDAAKRKAESLKKRKEEEAAVVSGADYEI